MTDTPTENSVPTSDEDIVGQVVERAAEKVAAVTPVANLQSQSALNRTEALGVIAAMLILLLASIFLLMQIRNDGRKHAGDTFRRQKAACEIISLVIPADEKTTAAKVAECLTE